MSRAILHKGQGFTFTFRLRRKTSAISKGLLITLCLGISLALPLFETKGNSDAGMEAKLSELQSKADSSPAREIDFEETRQFPFRKTPVQIEGVVRLWKDHGISIHYPENRTTIIVDDEGILLRLETKDGKIRERAAESENSETAALLASAFAFDKAELEQVFNLSYRETSENWELILTPKSSENSKLNQMTMKGLDQTVQSIQIEFDGSRSITITPTEERALETAPESFRDHYFRLASSAN